MIRIWQSAINNIITVREAVGVDVHIGHNDEWQIVGMHVKFVKKKLSIVATYGNLQSLKEKMPRNVPLVLVINGRGILMRQTATGDVDTIGRLFPGSNPGDFFSMPYQLSETEQYTFICRKTLVEQVVNVLAAEQLHPVTVTIGLSSFRQVLSFLDAAHSEITTAWYKISIRQKEVVTITYGEQPEGTGHESLIIGGLSIKSFQATLLGAILQVLLKPVNQLVDPTGSPGAFAARQQHKYYSLFRTGAWVLLITVLSLLLANFMLFSNYFNKNKELVQQIGLMNDEAQRNLVQQNEFNASWAFFMAAGWNKSTKHAYYIDHIAALTPASIRLTVLQTATREESFGSDLVFKTNKIQVNGISTDPTELEIFSRAIRNIQGVQAVAISNYLYKRELAAAVFFIEITIQV